MRELVLCEKAVRSPLQLRLSSQMYGLMQPEKQNRLVIVSVHLFAVSRRSCRAPLDQADLDIVHVQMEYENTKSKENKGT